MKQHVRLVLCVVGAAFVAAAASSIQAQVEPEPLWAWARSTQPKPGDKANSAGRSNQESASQRRSTGADEAEDRPREQRQYSLVDVRDGHNVIDWFPGDHPAMPAIIKNGPASLGETARGCGSCHLPNGKGRPENAPPAGQPVGYTIQTLRDFRDGKRVSADPRKPNMPTMTALAKAMTEEEMRQAAEYFSAMAWTPWIRVIEAERIPEMQLEDGNMYITVGKEPHEPLDGRIVETPEDAYQANMVRNPRSGWVAYVPVGSLAKGEKLVDAGRCVTCHGTDLMGSGDFPGIAGRSPSYMMRQLWDMKRGTRNGLYTVLMKPVVANLTADDLTAIVAYLASIKPPNRTPTSSQ